jgi:hypothetical protein
MTPMALDVALTVQQEIHTRLDEVDRMRHKQVEHARYEADLAQRRYMHVDPANRFVADTLEAEWNNKLRLLNEAQEQYERMRQQNHLTIDEALELPNWLTIFPVYGSTHKHQTAKGSE